MKTLWIRVFQLLLAIQVVHGLEHTAKAQSLVILNPVLVQHISLSSVSNQFINYFAQGSYILDPNHLTNSIRKYLVPSLGTEIATDDSGTVILFRENESLEKYPGSIRWSNDATNGNLLATMIILRDYTPSGRILIDCSKYDTTNCVENGILQAQGFVYTNNLAFTNRWDVPLYFWQRHSVDGKYVYGWVRLNRQLFYGYGGQINGIEIHGWANRALSPTEKLVLGPWVELNEGDEKIGGRPIPPERKMSISRRRDPVDGVLYAVVQVPPELCLKYELAVGNFKNGFHSRHFDDGHLNRYTRPEPYGYALAVAVDMDYGFEWRLTLGRFDTKVVDEVWFSDLEDAFFVKLVPHVQYPQEKFLFPP